MDELSWLVVRMIWTAHDIPVIPLRLPLRVNDVLVSPEAGHPFGRKGLQLEAAWKAAGEGSAGMLVIDGDVIIDLYDYAAMKAHIEKDPTMVWTSPTKIWPRSTGREAWTWDCWKGAEAAQEWPEEIDYFSFGFTFLPAQLLEAAIKRGLKRWEWPHVDQETAKTARIEKIPMGVVRWAQPKHLNW